MSAVCLFIYLSIYLFIFIIEILTVKQIDNKFVRNIKYYIYKCCHVPEQVKEALKKNLSPWKGNATKEIA